VVSKVVRIYGVDSFRLLLFNKRPAKKSKCGGWGLSAIGKCDKKVFRQIEIKLTVRVEIVHTLLLENEMHTLNFLSVCDLTKDLVVSIGLFG